MRTSCLAETAPVRKHIRQSDPRWHKLNRFLPAALTLVAALLACVETATAQFPPGGREHHGVSASMGCATPKCVGEPLACAVDIAYNDECNDTIKIHDVYAIVNTASGPVRIDNVWILATFGNTSVQDLGPFTDAVYIGPPGSKNFGLAGLGDAGHVSIGLNPDIPEYTYIIQPDDPDPLWTEIHIVWEDMCDHFDHVPCPDCPEDVMFDWPLESRTFINPTPCCDIDGSITVCPGAQSILFKACPEEPTEDVEYQWEVITGDAEYCSGTDLTGYSVCVDADDVCNGSFELAVTVTGLNDPSDPEDDCPHRCTLTVTVADTTAPTADKGSIDDCYASQTAAEQACLDATTNLQDDCADPADITKEIESVDYDGCTATIVVRVTDECENYTPYTYTTRIDGTPPTAAQDNIEECYETQAEAEQACLDATTNLQDNCSDPADISKEIESVSYNGCIATIIVRVTDECDNYEDYPYNTTVDGEPPTGDTGDIDDCYLTQADAEQACLAATTNLQDNCSDPADISKEIESVVYTRCVAAITVRLTDECGNTRDLAPYRTTVDGTPPTADQGQIDDCYDTRAEAEQACLDATTNLQDNCSGSGAITKEIESVTGDCEAEIVVRVEDECGNYKDYLYDTRIDSVPPTADAGTIGTCYDSLAEAEQAFLDALTNLQDNCSPPELITKTMHDSTVEGCNATIVIRLEDECGNYTDYVFGVQIDGDPPTADQGDIDDCYDTLAAAEQACLDALTNLQDNCSPPALITKTVHNSTLEGCDATIVIRVEDECGKYRDYTFGTRVDAEKPAADQGDIATCYPTQSEAEQACLDATTNLRDNCSAPEDITKEIESVTGDCNAEIVVRVTDECGNYEDYSYFTSIDGEAPTITCPSTLAVMCPGEAPVITSYADWVAAGGSVDDNCSTDEDFTFDHLGDQPVDGICHIIRTYRVTDACGNYDECTQAIDAMDETAPVIACPPAVTCKLCDLPAVATNHAHWVNQNGTALDNCTPADLLEYELVDEHWGSDTPPLTITRTYRVTDQCGNYDECTQQIDVLPGVIPTVSEWGLIVIALLLLTGLTITLRPRRQAGQLPA